MTKAYVVKGAVHGIKAGTILTVKEEDILSKHVKAEYEGRTRLIAKAKLDEISTADADTGDVPRTEDWIDAMAAKYGDRAPVEGSPETPEPEPKKPEPKRALKPGEFTLSSITHGLLPASGVDHVLREAVCEDWDDTMKALIPAIDPDYIWQPDLLEALWCAYVLNNKALLTGWPGTGKTTAIAQFCALIKHPLMKFNGKDGIEPSSFLGYAWAGKGGMEWKDGMLPQGVIAGCVVTIDEVMKLPAGVNMAMQGLYEDGGYLILDDKPGTVAEKNVYPHPMFRMFLTDNVKGTGDNFDKFAATQVQDGSTLDRFTMTIHVNYLPEEQETKMLKRKFPERSLTEIKKLVQFAGLVRKAYAKSDLSLTLSPRGLQTICKLLTMIPNVQRAIELAFLDKLGEQDEIDAVKGMVKTVW